MQFRYINKSIVWEMKIGILPSNSGEWSHTGNRFLNLQAQATSPYIERAPPNLGCQATQEGSPSTAACGPDADVAGTGGSTKAVLGVHCDTLSTLECAGASHSPSCWAGGQRPFLVHSGRSLAVPQREGRMLTGCFSLTPNDSECLDWTLQTVGKYWPLE